MKAMKLRSFATLAVAALICGCGAIRFESDPEPAPPPPPPPSLPMLAGDWAGVWEIEGQRIQGTLVMQQAGTDLKATFSSSALGGAAYGTGSLDGERIQLELKYNLSCPGTARLTGDLQGQGTQIEGALSATDCTGKADGTFVFARR
jgi:hypothetical protein